MADYLFEYGKNQEHFKMKLESGFSMKYCDLCVLQGASGI